MTSMSYPHEEDFTKHVDLGGFGFDVHNGIFIPTAGSLPPIELPQSGVFDIREFEEDTE